MNAPLLISGDIGTWTVLGPTDRKNGGGNKLWRVRCKCGVEYERTAPQLRAAPHCRACADLVRGAPVVGRVYTKGIDASTEAAVVAALRGGATTAQVLDRWPGVSQGRVCALRRDHKIPTPKARPRDLNAGALKRLEHAIEDDVALHLICERFGVTPDRVYAVRAEMDARREKGSGQRLP